jgi:GNAT superfamily N-acetyltransferase
VDADELLKVYDEQVRGAFLASPPPGWTIEEDGPVARALAGQHGFAMFVRDASGLDGEELVGIVDRTVAFFRDAGRGFEWKTFDHDRPDLVPLLLAAGAEAEEHETILMGEAATLAGPPALPSGLRMREVDQPADFERIRAMHAQVWDDDHAWLVDHLVAGTRAEGVRVFVVEDGDLVVSAAWLSPLAGTGVAGLWGGSTLAEYRGRGVYRALVAQRARLALSLGYPYLQVDASEDSRPILERLGLVVVGGTTPYQLG